MIEKTSCYYSTEVSERIKHPVTDYVVVVVDVCDCYVKSCRIVLVVMYKMLVVRRDGVLEAPRGRQLSALALALKLKSLALVLASMVMALALALTLLALTPSLVVRVFARVSELGSFHACNYMSPV